MKNLHYITVLIMIISGSVSEAQNHNNQAGKKNYNKFSYSKAIRSLERSGSKDTEANRLLAESYYISGNSEKAEQCYEAVVKAPDPKPEDYFRYAMMLRVNKKYAESEKWIEKFGETHKDDSRVTEYKLSKGGLDKLLIDEDRYKFSTLTINSSGQDFGPAYLNNNIVFTSSRVKVKAVERRWNGNGLPFLDMFQASLLDSSLSAISEPFSKDVNRKFHDGPASFSGDGKFMVCTRNNYTQKGDDLTTNLELFSAEFVDNKWKNEKTMPFNNKDYSVGQPSLSEDGNTLYFTSNMPGGFGGTDIYKTTRQKDGTWTKPENAGSTINTEGNEMFPFIHSLGILFFSSDGHVGLGGLDIFMSQIKPDGYGKIVNLGTPMNTNKDDFAIIVNKELTNGYMCSNRAGGQGDDDIYAFKVLKEFTFGKTIKGVAKDKNGNLLSDAVVKLYDEETKSTVSVISGEDGSYSFNVDADKNFTLKGKKSHYFDGDNKVTSFCFDDVITADVILEKDPGLSLYCQVTDRITNMPLKDVKIELINNISGKSEIIATSAEGDFRKSLAENKLMDKVDYTIKLEKEGYLSKSVNYTKVLDKEGQYSLNELLDFNLDKVSVGLDLAKIVSLKPIYFDLGKFNIRKDAAIELDKIVKLMNENPAMVVELGSHTDCRGSAASNEKLSEKRAVASAAYIKKRISDPSRIYGKGYGESKLKNDCGCEGNVKSTCTEAEHQENRRTEFIIIKL